MEREHGSLRGREGRRERRERKRRREKERGRRETGRGEMGDRGWGDGIRDPAYQPHPHPTPINSLVNYHHWYHNLLM